MQGLSELPCSPRYHVASAECVGDILPMSSFSRPDRGHGIMPDEAIGYLPGLLGCFEICSATLHQVRYPGHVAMATGGGGWVGVVSPRRDDDDVGSAEEWMG
ncbi:hypothetical protein NW754_006305 [Fusarium falciforme]|nr:hypothetical protein NW754_006305 [Fusarium falciforme]